MSKKRIGVTLTKPYLQGLDQMVKKGLYLDRQVAIRAALRLLFDEHGIESFTDKRAEIEKEDVEQ